MGMVYLVLPILGPSSLRDGIGLLWTQQPSHHVCRGSLSPHCGHQRSRSDEPNPETLDVYEELKRSAVEPYSAARDAYAQMRPKLVEMLSRTPGSER